MNGHFVARDPNRDAQGNLIVGGLTTAQRLFKKYYRVAIPRTFAHSREVDDTHGVLHTGNPIIDQHAMNQPEVRDICIAQMAELHAQGCPVTFAKPSQAPEIYKALLDHLNEHNFHYSRSIVMDSVIKEARMRDLPILDDFAGWIYPIAVRYMPKTLEAPKLDDNTLAGRMASRRGGGRGAPVKRRAPKVRTEGVQVMGEGDVFEIPPMPAKHSRQTDEMLEREFTHSTHRNGFI